MLSLLLLRLFLQLRWKKLISEYLAKLQANLQARTWLSRACSAVQNAWDNHVLACNFAKYSPILYIFFNDRLNSDSLLICLLTTPPNLKHVAVVPYNLSLIACFLTVMFHKVVWQHMQGAVGFY